MPKQAAVCSCLLLPHVALIVSLAGPSQPSPSISQSRHVRVRHRLLVTCVPACRKPLRAGKNDRYFDFNPIKSATYNGLCQMPISIVLLSRLSTF